ncbi:MAG: ABC transporter ATP-binding protein/permease [Lachnospiraceae bacterium]|nr:ABC transporter ATP-binding protein/permease [Lachnospiraceae bacterium]
MTLSNILKSARAKAIFVLTCLLFMVQETLNLLVVYRIGKVADYATEGNTEALLQYTLLSLLSVLAMYMVSIGAQAARSAMIHDGMVQLNDITMKNILLRPLLSFRKKEDSYYLNLFGTDMDMVCTDYLDTFPQMCGAVVSVIQVLVILLMMNPILILLALAMLLLPTLLNRLLASAVQKYRQLFSEASQDFTKVLKETSEGYETIRMDCSEEEALTRFHQSAEGKMTAFTRSNTVAGMVGQGSMSLSSLAGDLGIVLCAYLVLRGQLTLGLLLVASSYMSTLASGIGTVQQYITSILSTKKIREKLGEEADAPCQEEDFAPFTGEGTAAYENVSFSFGERQLYDCLNCTFEPGGCYAVVGESGSGKSTLLKLLLKYYEGYTGEIKLAGQDIRTLSEQEIYSAVGVVSQSPYLFNASLYENITMFSKEPSEGSPEYEKLLEELNLTALAERVGNQPLGDFGDKISGGERQRINIARNYRRGVQVMIFDEPVSGLDPGNASMINDFIFSHQEITRIVITHDWSPDYLRRFDAVIPIGEAALKRAVEAMNDGKEAAR